METEIVIENRFGYEIIASEMDKRLESIYTGIDETKKTFRSLFSAASLIVALLGALQIFSSKVAPGYEIYYYVLVGVSLALYILLIGGCIWMLAPIMVHGTTPENWDMLYDKFASLEDDRDVLKQLISNYISSINKNEIIVQKRYQRGKYFLYILPIIVVLLFVIGFLPRIPVP